MMMMIFAFLTFKDVKQIFPTCLILVLTLVITLTVIPYAFREYIGAFHDTQHLPKIARPELQAFLQNSATQKIKKTIRNLTLHSYLKMQLLHFF